MAMGLIILYSYAMILLCKPLLTQCSCTLHIYKAICMQMESLTSPKHLLRIAGRSTTALRAAHTFRPAIYLGVQYYRTCMIDHAVERINIIYLV